MINNIKKIALLAGSELVFFYRKREKIKIENKSLTDFVTEADKLSESVIITELNKFYPEIDVFAEESGGKKSDLYWLIDPLDGTKNFIQGIPFFSISIALIKNDKPVLGLIYDPIHQDFFHSEKGKGAYRNNKQYLLKIEKPLDECFLATGFPFKNKDKISAYLKSFEVIFNSTISMRRCGSAALDLAYTSFGTYQGFWEYGLQSYDLAAGILLVQESGQVAEHFDGKTNLLFEGHTLAGQRNCVTFISKIVQENFGGL